MDRLISLRNRINSWLYNYVIKPICFKNDPEKVHNLFISVGKFFGNNIFTKKLISLLFDYQNSKLEQTVLGIKFRNPIGLAAGFDKNGELISIIEDVGFGFTEVGSVTALPCKGNIGKRLDRIVSKRSLWVNYGLKNNGVIEIMNRLRAKKFNIPYGVNIAKTNCKETTDPKVGIKDYLFSLKKLNENSVGSYYVINISCPNSYGGQPFADAKLYERLLNKIDKLEVKKPVFIKLSPDLSKPHIDKLLDISKRHKIHGFICTNLTKKHQLGKGGLSGKVIEKKSNKLTEYVYKKTKGKYVIIGVGGVFSAEDAYKKIKFGATLIQIITGMIYNGPGLIGKINYELINLIEKDGYQNISEAIGASVK